MMDIFSYISSKNHFFRNLSLLPATNRNLYIFNLLESPGHTEFKVNLRFRR